MSNMAKVVSLMDKVRKAQSQLPSKVNARKVHDRLVLATKLLRLSRDYLELRARDALHEMDPQLRSIVEDFHAHHLRSMAQKAAETTVAASGNDDWLS